LHHKATHQNLFEMDHGEYGIKPYIIGDKKISFITLANDFSQTRKCTTHYSKILIQ
jgi:hypothetical protein